MSTPTYQPGDAVNGHVLTPEGFWAPVAPEQPKKTGPSMGTRIAIGVCAALLVTVGGAVLASGGNDRDAAASTKTPVTTSADTAGLTAAENAFIVDVETVAGYDAGVEEEAQMLFAGNTFCSGFEVGLTDQMVLDSATEEGLTAAEAQGVLDATRANLCPAA